MAYSKQFNRALDGLYKRRTDGLRRILDPKPGPIRGLTKKQREKKILELEEIASKGLGKKLAKLEFSRVVTGRKSWRSKGREERKKSV